MIGLLLLLSALPTWAEDLVLAAPLEAARTTPVYAQLAGMVKTIAAHEGQAVAAGDTLVRLDDTELRLHQLGVPPLFRSCTFAGLDPNSDPEAFSICQQYARQGEYQDKRGLLLRGQPGNGKTSLAIAILRQVLAQRPGRKVRFWNVPWGLYQLRRTCSRMDRVPYLQDLVDQDLIVLDDLGRQQMTPWIAEQLYLLFDELWTGDKQVIITTNLTAAAFVQTMDPALVSRILGLCHEVPLHGPDRRS